MIEIKNASEYCVTGKFDINGSVSADEDTKKEAKKFTLRIVCDKTPLPEILQSMAANKKIVWQSGARNKFASILNGSIVEYPFKGGRVPETPEQVKAKAKAVFQSDMEDMTQDEKIAYLKAQGLL